MSIIQKKEYFNIDGSIITHEPLWRHTTFSVGGTADLYAVPEHHDDLATLLVKSQQMSIPVFILGGGSNLLVSDQGIRGLVIDMSRFTNISPLEIKNKKTTLDTSTQVVIEAGLPISTAAWLTASQGLSGLEYFFSMPGTLGGAIWMNARCYDGEISDHFAWADIMDKKGSLTRVTPDPSSWDYKKSPFQTDQTTIIRAAFNLLPDNPDTLKTRMLEYRENRISKGHFRLPCAGSAFKNNRSFGAPSGVLIDRCGLKGYQKGSAAVSDWHGNIIINQGGASARDIHTLLEHVSSTVHAKLGFTMEPEICITGDWNHKSPTKAADQKGAPHDHQHSPQ